MKKESISVSWSFEYLVRFLFGSRSYRGFEGQHKYIDWKKLLLKILKAIRKSILVNIDTTDKFHKNKILDLCNQAIQKTNEAGSKDKLNVTIIEYLIRIIFELLGEMPYHWEKAVVNRSGYWKLDQHRKLAYLQTPGQKANLILFLRNWPPYCDKFSDQDKNELFHKYRFEFDGDGDQFIEWFKQKHKDIYLELF